MWALLAVRSAWAGKDAEALAASARAIELDSLQSLAYLAQVYAYVVAGRRAAADSAAAHFVRLSGPNPWQHAVLADYYRRTGNLAAARELLVRLRAVARRDYVPPSRIGGVLLALGDRAGALDALEASVRNRDLNLIYDMINLYYSLSGEPRFEAVRHRVFGDRPVPRIVYP
jgi:tetratricopeptide (TPR) repeat protein